MDAAGSAPRYGELTYTSFDGVAGPGAPASGGWQVKEVRGGLTAPEIDVLRSQISTQLDLGVVIPAFPTADEIAALPRRLVYAAAPGGAAAYWHTAPAGVDGSGRPGNVFVHVVLDRRPAAESWRPIDLWRSPDWLTPYDAPAVRAAGLGAADHPGPGATVTRESVLTFLLDPTRWRLGVFRGLLDAVAAALDGGPRVVLGVEDVDSAAQWIGAVTHLMSAGTSRTLFFSTLERPAGLASAWARGVHLACVPRSDLGAVRASGVVVVDEAETLAMGALGGEPHITGTGSRIAVTPWSVFAQVAFQDVDLARRAVDTADAVAEAVGDVGLRHDWPLAMATLLVPELAEDAREEAALVVSRSTPDGLEAHPDLLAVAFDAVRSLVGEGTERTWTHVAPGGQGTRSVIQRLLLETYADRALQDTTWLLRAGGAPLPDDAAEFPYPRALDAAAGTVAAVERRVRGSRDLPEQRTLAVLVLRVLDVLARLGVMARPSPARDALYGRIEDLVAQVAVPLLLDDAEAGGLIASAEPLAPGLLAAAVRDLVSLEVGAQRAAFQGRLGSRVPAATAAVLTWSKDWRGVPLEAMVHGRDTIDALDAELAVALLAGGRIDPGGAHERLGLVASLHDLSLGLSVDVDLERAGGALSLGPGELTALVEAFGEAVPQAPLGRVVAGAPWTADLARLCGALERAQAPWGGPSRVSSVARLVELRRLASLDLARPRSIEDLLARAGRIIDLVDLAHRAGVVRLADDAVAQARLAVVACALLDGAVAVNPSEPGWADTLSRALPREVDAGLVGTVVGWVWLGVAPVETATTVAIVAAPDFPVPALVSPVRRAAGMIKAAPEGISDGLLDHVVRAIARQDPVDPVGAAVDVGDWVADRLAQQGRSERDSENAGYKAERFAEPRLRRLVPKGGGLFSGAISRFRKS